jgi:uncharacterized repeat protein (TIGR02543 family)
MKKSIILFLLLATGLVGFAQLQTAPQWTRVLSDQPETFRTQLISSSENSIKVNIQVPGFYATNVATPRGEAKIISMPKAVSTAQAGEPNVPMTGIPAIIGDHARMSIRVLDAQYMDFEGIEVAPSKGDFPRTIDPATVPYTYGECYSQDAFFPANNVGLYEPYIVRDFRGQNMVVYPYAYNPVTKTLRVYYNMTIEMYKVDNNGENAMAPRRSNTIKMDPDFKSMYQRHFINYQAAMNRYTPVDEEGDLLIICYDNFISSMTDFVNWKKTRGVNTTIVGTSTAGSTYSAIQTYIRNQYNANNNLTHVLLVGDVAQIPGYTYSGGGSSYGGKGDNAYGQIVGSDYYNDVFIGRFSASTAARVTTQCNRVITYERDLTTSATWLQVAQGIAKKEGGSGHNGEDDYQHMDVIRTDLLNYGYNTVYQRYENLSGYTATASQISSDINNGVGIINYCNHGAETMWGVASYSVSHVNALTNNNKLPFIWSVACLVGKYDYSSDCFAEAWMNATNNNNPTGAIGTLMSYISQPWIPPMWAQDECVDILAGLSSSGGTKHTWGGISINGLFGIFDNYGTDQSAVGTYQAWILYGDPSMLVRTKTPQAMTVTHSGSITLGSSNYTVNVTNGNGAVATITDANHNILGKATVSNNTATISLNSSNLTPGSELTLCVFGFNKVTYLGTISVVGGTQYNITVTQPQHGTISAPSQAYANSTVTLTATPETGYCLSSWTVKKGNTNITVTNNQFTMPEGDVTVTATFVQGLVVTLAPVTNGSISADPVYALQGTTINLTATPASGYEFGSWTVYKTGDANTTVAVNGNSFTMPAYSVTVSASFVQKTDLTVYDGTATNQYIPMYGYYFDDFTKSECILPASQLTAMNGCTITAVTFYPSSVATTNSTWSSTSQTVFLKEVSGTTLGGSFSGTSGATTVKQALLEMPTAGEAYTITFDTPYTYNGGNLLIGVYNTDDGSYNKVEWYGTSGLTSGVSAYGSNASSLSSVGYNAQSFLPKTTFTYMPASNEPVAITVSANPANGGAVTGAGTYEPGATVTLTATANEGYTFANWTKNGVVMSTSATYSFTVSTAAAYVANFTLNSYTVTATANPAEGGTVSFGRNRDDLVYDFEDGWQNWTAFKGTTGTSSHNWMHNTEYVAYDSNGNQIVPECHNSSTGMMLSESYISASTSGGSGTAVTPDNYLVSPQIRLGGSFTFYAASRMSNYPAEKFSVLVSESGNNSASYFTHTELTVTLSDNSWHEYTVDLSAYSGMGYVAIRHWDCNDQHLLYVDDVTIVEGQDGSTGSGNFNYGETCVVTAIPNAEYNFVNWTENGTAVSSDATYAFTVTGDRALVANFSQNLGTQYTITANANPTAGGTVSGAGTYNENGTCTLTATAATGYTFVNWTKDGVAVSTNATYSFTVTGDATYVANFALNSYEVAATANPTAGGTISGAGTYSHGATVTLTATANEGYTFTNWTRNGVAVSTNATYSFTVTGDAAYVANFTLNSYTVTATANPTEGGTVTVGTRTRDDLVYDFEDGWQEWTTFQGNTTSPNSWMHNTAYPTTNNNFSTGYGYDNSDGFMLSESYISGSTSGSGTAVTPDNYLVSPQVLLGGSISFYAGARNTSYCAEKFSVMVSTTGNSDAASFTTVGTWTLSLSQAGYNSTPYTVDLSAYSGMGYIAIRHFDCYDQWFLAVDNVTIVEGPDNSTGSGNFNYGETCVVTATPMGDYHFVKWTQDGNVVSTEASYSFTVTEDADLVANFAIGYDQTVTLSEGMNWWSTYLDITLDDLKSAIEAALEETGGTAIIKSNTGFITYQGGRWRPSSMDFDISQMYQIQVSTTCTITLTGVLVDPAEHPITIRSGVNWIGYLSSESMTLESAFSGLNPVNGDMIKSKDAYATYNGTRWRGGLVTLEPGQGYIYHSKATEDKTFVYETNNNK